MKTEGASIGSNRAADHDSTHAMTERVLSRHGTLEDDTEAAKEIRLGQMSNFRRQLLIIAGANFVNAGLTAVVFSGAVSTVFLAAWVAAIWLAAFRSTHTWWRQRSRPEPTEFSRRSLVRAAVSTCVVGALWGGGAAVMFPSDVIAQQIFLVFVIGGMAAGHTAMAANFPLAWAGFVLSAVSPLIAMLLLAGDSLQLVMAAMLAVYTAGLWLIMRVGYASFVSGVGSRLKIARLAEEIEQSDERYRALVENAPDAIFITDDGKVKYANPAATRLLGADKPDQLLGRSMLDFMHPDFHEQARLRKAAVLESRPTLPPIEYKFVRLDGAEVEIEATSHRIAHGDGRTIEIVARDITERKHADKALRESEQRYRALIQQAPDAIVITCSGRYVFVNQAAVRLFGAESADQLIDIDATGMIHPDQRNLARERIEGILVTNQPLPSFDYRMLRLDGSVVEVEALSSPIMWEGAPAAQSVLRDVTERKLEEDRQRHHEAELARVLRVNTMGEMAVALAHQLNQPLTAIANYTRGCLRFLRSGSSNAEELEAALQKAADEAERAGQMVREIGHFIRTSEPRRSPSVINDIVRSVATLEEAELNDTGVRLVLDLSDGIPPVPVDEIEIEQVLLNLVRNGVEAMKETRPGERALTIRTALIDGEAVEIVTSDTGPGLDPETVEKIFEPFFSSKPDGMGMGLSISRTIVEAHGGKLRAAQIDGGGAALSVTLPLNEDGDGRPS